MIVLEGGGPFTLEPDSSLVIEVVFSPDAQDGFEALLEIHHDDPSENSPLEITLQGTGGVPTYANPSDPGLSDDREFSLPNTPQLHQNYPNPFNPVTVIEYALPSAMQVRLEIFDIMGRQVKTLVDQIMPAGQHQAVWDASYVSSGTYFYRLYAGDHIQTRFMTLIR
jgi:hypothetical protein